MGGHNKEEIRDRLKNEYMELVDLYLPKKWQIISSNISGNWLLVQLVKAVDFAGQVKVEDEWGINALLATFQQKI